ncbi:MAG: hypothetical protein BECKG1743D_GA0114223_110202 [Candidatus Kentron sp. G]|nr:MAG: hypothetical protein BECKG1743F_GA0114225_108321 [Candidatus Kentron sp. G]VFN06251.1 MAG: hypothetical protein BECKG1743E_GA0114224_109871 [Candidatus Kentron sp. G]VFN07253.1 MAG: hypothetical protein BECKG1743D_GA0114223_110202 [Candidatus Kentron sp. G]
METSWRALALLVLASAVLTTAVNHPALQAAIAESLSRFPAALQFYLWLLDLLTERASNLAYLWRFNLNDFDIAPWQWLNITGAALTFALFYYSDRVHRAWTLAKEPAPAAAPEDAHIGRLLLITRLRNLCVFPKSCNQGEFM